MKRFLLFATLTLLTAAGASAQRGPTGIVKPACPPAATGQIILPITGLNLRQPLGCLVLDSASFVQDNSTTPPTIRLKVPVTLNFMDSDSVCATAAGATVTLTNTPNPAASFVVSVNGLVQTATVDFTIAGAVVTFGTPILATDVVRCGYRF